MDVSKHRLLYTRAIFIVGGERMITNDDFELFRNLIEAADKTADGHLTVMKFTTNWRVSFATPDDRDTIAAMHVGKTFAEAAQKALNEAHSR